ncbi:expressed unknown protein [Seminavis robusta]|uniref:Uncharacterized protein n=1 Tax=Seminavis robusta TaxID=568900 RepID=A0A9N8DVN5_9STRA|nr:expressed unknown protein [Seminavis robusta]|eukprot:Sro391_g133170.1 n/a (109) ;mRNA; f:55952-56422
MGTILWYAIVVLLLNVVFTNDEIQEKKDGPALYLFQVLFWMCYPLHARWRKGEPDMSHFFIYGMVLSLAKVPLKSTIVTSSAPNKASDPKLSDSMASRVQEEEAVDTS